MGLNITFQPPLSHERSVKFNMLHFMSQILAECPHLGIAIFNRNYVGDLESSSRSISLLHVLDSQHRLKFVPLEIHIACQMPNSGPHAPAYCVPPSTYVLYAFTPGATDDLLSLPQRG